MTDARPDHPAEPPLSLSEAVDLAIRRMSMAVLAAGAVIGLAIYARPAPPRYDAFAFGNEIVRVDQKTGTIISCQGEQTCKLILKRGQRLTRIKRSDAAPALPRPPAPRLPAPAPAAEKSAPAPQG